MTKPSLLIVLIYYFLNVSNANLRISEDVCGSERDDQDKTGSHPGSSQVLLQVNSKATSFAQDVSEHRLSAGGVGETAPLDEGGYLAVLAECCFEDMATFITRQAVQLGFEVCEVGWLNGVSMFFDCADDGNSYNGLVDTLRSGTVGPCAGLAPAGQCKPLESYCPEFPDATPPPCASSNQDAVAPAVDAAPVPAVVGDTPAPVPAVVDPAVTAAPVPMPPVVDAEAPIAPAVTDAPQAPVVQVTASPPAASPMKKKKNMKAPAASALAPAFATSAIGCFHYSYFAMKCKSSCPDGNDYVDASWPDCAVSDKKECVGLFVDGAQMKFSGPNQCQAQCQSYKFLTKGDQHEVQPEGDLLRPSDVKMILMPLGNQKKKRCNGDPWLLNGKTWGNLGSFGSSKECSRACIADWACIIAVYRIDNGQCSMMKGGVCHIRDTSKSFGGEDEEYDVWEKVCST